MSKSGRRKFLLIFIPLLFFILVLLSFIMPLDPYSTSIHHSFALPEAESILGCDDLGRDIFSRLLIAIRITVFIAFGTAFISGLLGAFMGTIAGYFGRKTDAFISMLINITLAFPSLLLAIGVTLFMPPGLTSIVIAISLTGWAGIARVIRSHVMILKKSDYITAASLLGAKPLNIIFRHILPNSLSLIIVSVSLKLGSFILAESGLSFLGLGVPPPLPTLGRMVADGRDFLFTASHIPFIPGLAAGLLVLAVNIWGELLEEKLNPKTENIG